MSAPQTPRNAAPRRGGGIAAPGPVAPRQAPATTNPGGYPVDAPTMRIPDAALTGTCRVCRQPVARYLATEILDSDVRYWVHEATADAYVPTIHTAEV